MTLRIHDTRRRRKVPFKPRDEGHVRVYVCGPTVYDYAHIGNARPVVVFDVLYRVLKHLYRDSEVTYVRNITDVDDKIIAAAEETGEPIDAITTRTTKAFHKDMAALGALPPDFEPRATEHIPAMIALVEKLLEKGHAYEAEGHVLFSVPSMPGYGGLSKLAREDLVAGARVEVAPYKKDPADFVLWKPSAEDLPGWESPWGRGRPGWHLECSVMSEAFLGPAFDIHGGGQDLIFPHHENEIAQSTCVHGPRSFAKYWMHNGYLMAEGEKMSKSLGNYYTVHELLDEYPGEAIRLVLLKTHYRQPLDFTKAGIEEATRELDGFYGALREAPAGAEGDPPGPVIDALADDLNTPKALSHLHGLAARLNKAETTAEREAAGAELRAGAGMLGLLARDPDAWFKEGRTQARGIDEAAVEARIQEREQARKDKDFAMADRIRDELAAKGVLLEDGPEGTTWKRG